MTSKAASKSTPKPKPSTTFKTPDNPVSELEKVNRQKAELAKQQKIIEKTEKKLIAQANSELEAKRKQLKKDAQAVVAAAAALNKVAPPQQPSKAKTTTTTKKPAAAGTKRPKPMGESATNKDEPGSKVAKKTAKVNKK